MTDWTEITRNARTSGDFAGRSTAEQDAYFATFAGDGPRVADRARHLWRRTRATIVRLSRYAAAMTRIFKTP